MFTQWTPTPLDSELAYCNTSPTLITHDRSNAAVKTGAWWTAEGEWEADALASMHGRRHGISLGGPQWQVTAGYSGWQRCGGLLQRKPRQTQRVCRLTFGSRSSQGKFVSRPGNLFPGKFISRELTSLVTFKMVGLVAMSSFTEKCCHLVSAQTASVWRVCSSIH